MRLYTAPQSTRMNSTDAMTHHAFASQTTAFHMRVGYYQEGFIG